MYSSMARSLTDLRSGSLPWYLANQSLYSSLKESSGASQHTLRGEGPHAVRLRPMQGSEAEEDLRSATQLVAKAADIRRQAESAPLLATRSVALRREVR